MRLAARQEFDAHYTAQASRPPRRIYALRAIRWSGGGTRSPTVPASAVSASARAVDG